jgi:hypothetical protein
VISSPLADLLLEAPTLLTLSAWPRWTTNRVTRVWSSRSPAARGARSSSSSSVNSTEGMPWLRQNRPLSKR